MMRNIKAVCLAFVALLGACASDRGTGRQVTVFDLETRMAQVRFKQFMVNLAVASSPGIKMALEREPSIQSADVVIDYELPAKAAPDALARMPILVAITWRDAANRSDDPGAMVRRACRQVGMDEPFMGKSISDAETTMVRGYFLIRSTSDGGYGPGYPSLQSRGERNAKAGHGREKEQRK